MVYKDDYSNDEEGGFFKRFRGPLIAGAAVAIVAGFVAKQLSSGHSAPARKQADITMVNLTPPPPPPPPPPQPPEPKVEKMVEQTPVAQDEPKPDDKPPDAAPDMSTNNKGPGGPDGFGLGGRSGNGGNGSGHAGSGSKWGWYAAQVQTRIADALRRNSRTKYAGLSLKVRVWPDAAGRIERASLAGTTGDTALDEVIKNQVLTGLQLQDPPPHGMPTPIVLRITARKPN